MYVAEDLATASQFLGNPSGSGRRVWASDCLSPADNCARFASVAAHFQPGGQRLEGRCRWGALAWPCLHNADVKHSRFVLAASAGDVVVPTDLLSYGSKHEAAVLRAFGGFVIARNDAGG